MQARLCNLHSPQTPPGRKAFEVSAPASLSRLPVSYLSARILMDPPRSAPRYAMSYAEPKLVRGTRAIGTSADNAGNAINATWSMSGTVKICGSWSGQRGGQFWVKRSSVRLRRHKRHCKYWTTPLFDLPRYRDLLPTDLSIKSITTKPRTYPPIRIRHCPRVPTLHAYHLLPLRPQSPPANGRYTPSTAAQLTSPKRTTSPTASAAAAQVTVRKEALECTQKAACAISVSGLN